MYHCGKTLRKVIPEMGLSVNETKICWATRTGIMNFNFHRSGFTDTISHTGTYGQPGKYLYRAGQINHFRRGGLYVCVPVNEGL